MKAKLNNWAVSDWGFFVSKELASFVLFTQTSKNYFPFWKGEKWKPLHKDNCSQEQFGWVIFENLFMLLIVLLLDRRVSVKR